MVSWSFTIVRCTPFAMKKHFWVFLVLFACLTVLFGPMDSRAWRRRRRRRCPVRNCILSDWYNVGSCSRTCGGGRILQRKSIKSYPSCGGWGCPSFNSPSRLRYSSCNTQCCRVNCVWTWSAWGSCSGSCGMSTQTRTVYIQRNPSCGGTACPRKRSETQSCNTGV